jgi:hypothetical protein
MNFLINHEGREKQLASLPEEFREAHRHSIHHRAEIEASALCGCFYCCSVFPPGEITDWGDTYEPDTAACPHCGIDSVIGSAAGFPITDAFLTTMKRYCFV